MTPEEAQSLFGPALDQARRQVREMWLSYQLALGQLERLLAEYDRCR